jgi:PAS domain S-box-containing protein
LFVNARVEAMFGFPRQELLGRKVEMLVPERCRQGHIAHRASYMERPGARLMGSGLELLARHRDGAEIPVEVSLSHMDTEEGGVVVSAVRDISDRLAARGALAESEARAATLLESLPDGVAVIADGRCAYVNAAFCGLVGWAREEATGSSVLVFVAPEDRERAQARITAILGGAPAAPAEYGLRKKDGSLVPVEAYSQPILQSGRPALLSIFRDLTIRKTAEEERERLQAQLHHARKLSALGTLAAGIAHDCNNVLQSIFGYGGMVLEEADDDPAITRNVEKMLRAATHGKHVIRRLLEFSRQLQSDRRPMQVETIVDQVLEIVRPLLDANVVVRWEERVASSPVRADAVQLHEVVSNLLANARDAIGRDGGTIEISTRDVFLETEIETGAMRLQPGFYVCLRVRDSGAGMDSQTRERLFEPFFTTKPRARERTWTLRGAWHRRIPRRCRLG